MNKAGFNKDIYINQYIGLSKSENNLIMSTFIANFHIKFGLKNKGIEITKNIVDNISNKESNLVKKNLLLWNNYILLEEYIELEMYNISKEILKSLKNIYSRESLLGDIVGNFHISWYEQILLKEADINFKIENFDNAIELCKSVIYKREKIKLGASSIGEKVKVDRCKSEAYYILGKIYFNIKIEKAIEYIKLALYHKSVNKELYKVLLKKSKDIGNQKGLKSMYIYLIKCYSREGSISYDNIRYLYCKSCKYNSNNICDKNKFKISEKKTCRLYKPILVI